MTLGAKLILGPNPRSQLRRPLPLVLGILALLAGTNASPARAQSDDTNRVVEGDTVRVRMDGGLTVEAAFHRWDDDQMLLSVDGLEEPWAVSVFEMRSLQVFTDRTRPEGFRHGALLGATAGLFVGAAIGAVLHFSGVTEDPSAAADEVVNKTLRGAAIGIAIGALGYGAYRGQRPGRGWIGLELPTR